MSESNEIEKEFEEVELNDDWEDAFKTINTLDTESQVKLSYVHAKHSSNERFNRYRNILPYDHSRIKLKDANDTDYINANLVESKLSERKYILTQGPLKNTCEHFWQMVWEKNTKGIIMLNKLYEKGFLKCEMYFPNADEDNGDMTLKFGKFNLNYVSETPFEDFSIRIIECENLEQKETREIYHLHFTNWPDFGEPENSASFLKFLNECKKRNIFDLSLYGPPVVHCSAGVGRSGTFILVDSMIEIYRIYGDNIPIRVSNLLAEMRTYRMGLVQTHQQFKFAFQAIVDYMNQARCERRAQVSPIIDDKKSSETGSSEENDDDNDDDDDDDSDNEQKSSNLRRRPGTAFGTKNQNSKRFKPTEQRKNKIKNLRQLQLKNKLDQDEDEESVNCAIATARPRASEFTNEEVKQSLSSSESNVDENDNDDDESTPFAKSSRDIQTVRVNQPRTPLIVKPEEKNAQIIDSHNEILKTSEIKLITSENNTIYEPAAQSSSHQILDNKSSNSGNFQSNSNIYQRNVPSTSTESFTNPSSVTSQPRNRCLSDKEKRIDEKVKLIKQKMIVHEQRQKLMRQLKPFLIGGSILFGSFLLFQLYRKIF